MEQIIANETYLRLGFSFGGLIVFFALGLIFPFRKTVQLKNPKRWLSNISLTFTSTFVMRLLMSLGLTSLTILADQNSFGFFHLFDIGIIPEFILGLLLLDMVIYWQHRASHVIPILWRLHRVHHSDTEYDVTTANRFNPIEIVLSYLLKTIFVLLLGVSPATIIIFEILLNFSALFHHGNYSLPSSLEKIVRIFIITPDMHRIHHSVIVNETNSNYGFFLSIWDKIYGSYTHKAKGSPQSMPIGLNEFREKKHQSFLALLKLPFT